MNCPPLPTHFLVLSNGPGQTLGSIYSSLLIVVSSVIARIAKVVVTYGARVAASFVCYDRGMTRPRLSTTVDSDLLDRARRVRDWPNDATMIDAALTALIDRHRQAEIDASYEAYARIPLDEPDEWGSLASFHAANATHGDAPTAADGDGW